MSSSNASTGRLRGAHGRTTRPTLEALREPGRVPDLVKEMRLPLGTVWATVKHLHEQGLLDRVNPGVYQINARGEEALKPRPTEAAKLIRTGAPRPPEGKGWTPERSRWLEKHYGRLGHHRCGELLGVNSSAVHAKATKLGLRYGEVDGYTLPVDVAELLLRDYVMLYSRAERAKVLTFPGTTAGQEYRRKAMVPDWWVEQIADEIQPPEPGDVLLAELRQKVGLSKTQATRVAGRDARLRTPIKGGQAMLYIPTDVAERITARYREKRKTPAAPVVGRGGVLTAIRAAGAEGRTERELYEALPCSQAAVRLHVRALYLAKQLDRCRMGDSSDPFVYRDLQYTGQPQPTRRRIVLPGRPRKAALLPEAAD